jgi:hypothetical protein
MSLPGDVLPNFCRPQPCTKTVMKPGMDVLVHSLKFLNRGIGFTVITRRQNETSTS